MGKLDGVADNAAPENGPLCDLKRAFSLSLNTGINVCSLWWRSTLDAASCCHPVREEPGSNSSGNGGRAPCKTACQEGGSKPMTPDNSTSRMGSNQRHWSCTNNETLQKCVCHIAVLWSMPNESPQLAQEAHCFVRVALRSPRPPRESVQWHCGVTGPMRTEHLEREGCVPTKSDEHARLNSDE